jgi:rubrerythrin
MTIAAKDTFNAFEIFEIAEQIERNGAQFYRRAAEVVCEPDVKDTLLRLAEMEDEHEKAFADMRSNLLAPERQITAFDPLSEIAQYLHDLANGHIFDLRADPGKQLAGDVTTEDILKMAITAEKDSIVFYLGLKDLVSAEAGKSRVDAIISEEMQHLKTITAMCGK